MKHPLSSAFVICSIAFAGCSTMTSGESDSGVDSGPVDSGSSDAGGNDSGPSDAGAGDGGVIQQRPYQLHVPPGYVAGTPAPLLLMLHGYGVSPALEESYLQLTALSDEKGFLYALPSGTADLMGDPFWNATDACCNFYGSTVDDVAYLSAVIDDVESHYTVDGKRIYIYGHSNGGFMANRAGCDLAPRIAAFVSMAGANWSDASKCQPASPISMIQFHGTADAEILYDGGAVDPRVPTYPSAHQTVADWAASDSCDGGLQDGGTVDVVSGMTTTVARYAGCAADAGVELWSVQGGSHIPPLQPSWAEPFWTFLAAHHKP